MPPEEKQETTSESPQPTTSESSETSSPQSNAEFENPDFSTLIAELDSDDGAGDIGDQSPPDPVVETAQQEKASEEVAEEPETPKAEEETPPPQEEAAEAKEEEKEKGELPEPEELPQVKMPTREELEGLYTEHREKTLPELEKLFTLSDEQIEAFQDNPGEVLPKLASQIMYDSMMSSFNAVMAALPSTVNRLISVSEETKQAEGAFFERWSELKDPKLKNVVQQSVRAYRQANPTASLNEVIENSGRLAMMQAGLDPAPKPPKPAPTPSRPAGAGASASPMPPKRKAPEEDNIFAELTEAFQREFG